MRFHFEPGAVHADGIAHAVVSIHHKAAGEHMHDLAVGRRQRSHACRLNHPVHVGRGDLVVTAAHRDDPAGVGGGNVFARHANVQCGDRHAGHAFGAFHSVFNRAGRGLNVDDHPLAHAGGRRAAHAGDVHLAILVSVADDRTHLRSPNVQSHDVLLAQYHRSCTLLHLVVPA